MSTVRGGSQCVVNVVNVVNYVTCFVAFNNLELNEMREKEKQKNLIQLNKKYHNFQLSEHKVDIAS